MRVTPAGEHTEFGNIAVRSRDVGHCVPSIPTSHVRYFSTAFDVPGLPTLGPVRPKPEWNFGARPTSSKSCQNESIPAASSSPCVHNRTSLLAIVCISHLPGATALHHPLYFEERKSGLFETRAAGQSAAIRADRVELDGATLRFLHPSKNARLEGLGASAPSNYISSRQTRTFRQYPKAGVRRVYPGIDVTFYGRPGRLEYDLDLDRGARPDRNRIQVSGSRGVRLDQQGDLIVNTPSGELRQLAPRPNPARRAPRNSCSRTRQSNCSVSNSML
jgi:hypothetical protein